VYFIDYYLLITPHVSLPNPETAPVVYLKQHKFSGKINISCDLGQKDRKIPVKSY
jgi:hypothetical protein